MSDQTQQQTEEPPIEQVVVTVVDDPAPAKSDDAAAAAAGDQEDPALDLKTQFETMKKRAESAEGRAARAERAAKEASQRVAQASTASAEAHLDSVASGLEAAQAELDGLQREATEAGDAADFKRLAEVQAKIGKIGYRIGRLEEAKVELESRKTSAPEKTEKLDPVEAFARTRTPESAAWIRAHPEFVTDMRKNTFLSAAHFDAEDKGMTVDTPEYFDHIETYIGLKQPAVAKTEPKTAAPARKTSVPPVAPVSSRPGASATAPRRVELSRSEAAAATDGTIVWNYDDPSPQKRFRKGEPIGLNEFARRKSLMKENGQYDRTYSEE